jgi:hypothetical protein
MHAETFTYWLPMNTDINDTDTTGFTRVLMKTLVLRLLGKCSLKSVIHMHKRSSLERISIFQYTFTICTFLERTFREMGC